MKVLTVVLLGLWMAACVPEPKARHTVDEYRADPELRHAQVQQCAKDPGTLRATPDCINAHTAGAFEDRTSLREAPPVGLKKDEETTRESVDPRQE